MTLQNDRERCLSLLLRWCGALLEHRVDSHVPALSGGLLCPACAFVHGRIGDAVLPFLTAYAETGDETYRTAALGVVDWSEKNVLRPDGSYVNDKLKTWKCTTVFSQLALGKALLRFGDRLPETDREKLTAIFRRQTTFLYSYFPAMPDEPNVNYEAAFCEAMMLAYRLLGDETYRIAAGKKAKALEAFFTPEGLLFGEGHPRDGLSAGGFRCVDVAYNVEESLPALVSYAAMANDGRLKEKLKASLLAHMEFFLPDGGWDDSFGTRSAKWTYYGSRTSDGALEAFCLLAPEDPVFAKAAWRTLDLYERCTAKNGLLSGGLFYGDADEPSCLHHTLCHTKALCHMLAHLPPDAPEAILPREKTDRRVSFPSVGVELCAVGPFRATFSENDFSYRRGTLTGGGSMTLLWHEKRGLVCAATMAEYSLIEPLNMQYPKHGDEVPCLTPRVEKGAFSSVNARGAKVVCRASSGVFTYRAQGLLTDPDGHTDGAYAVLYRVDKTGVSLAAFGPEGASLVLPIVSAARERVEINGNTAVLGAGSGAVRLSSDAELRLLPGACGGNAFSPVAGLLCAVFSVGLASTRAATVRLTVD